MKLEYITPGTCPECGCAEVAKLEIRIDGEKRNETLKYTCGYSLRYLPFERRIASEDECRKSVRSSQWKTQRGYIAEAMICAAKAYVKRPDIDLSVLERNLRSDLDCYRDELEAAAETQESPCDLS